MTNKNQSPYQEVVVSHVVLSGAHKQMAVSLKSEKHGFVNRLENGKFTWRIPYFKKLLSGKKKVRYILPKGGVPIVAGPDVINRLTAMARMKRSYTYSM